MAEERGESLKPDSESNRSGREQDDGQASDAELNRLIGGEVIPRLLMAHTSFSERAPVRPQPTLVTDAMIDDVTSAVLTLTDQQLLDQVQEVLLAGVSKEQLFLDVLAPIARALGERWEQDTLNFAEVTMGLIRLQSLLRRYAPDFVQTRRPVNPVGRILLSAMPGEQHTFGLLIVSEFFRRAEWDVFDPGFNSPDMLVQEVSRQQYSVVGLSLSNEEKLQDLADLIRSIRGLSKNPDIGILVGGWLFSERPHLADFVGADCGADTPQAAISTVQRWAVGCARPC